MKKIIIFLLFLLFVVKFSFVKADQLAFISKEQAEETVAALKKVKSLTLYCGCCDNDTPQKIKVVKIYSRFTGFEGFYEIIVEYKTKDSDTIQKTALDLAYVWVKEKKKFITVAELMKYNYRACKNLNNFSKA